jgi:hypothetical protein
VLALLPLAELLNLGFARLLGGARASALATTFTRRLRLSACAGDHGCDNDYWKQSHAVPLFGGGCLVFDTRARPWDAGEP